MVEVQTVGSTTRTSLCSEIVRRRGYTGRSSRSYIEVMGIVERSGSTVAVAICSYEVLYLALEGIEPVQDSLEQGAALQHSVEGRLELGRSRGYARFGIASLNLILLLLLLLG